MRPSEKEIEDDDLLNAPWPDPLKHKIKVNCLRELEKQKAFGYMIMVIAALLVIYFIIGIGGNYFLPLDSFNKFAMCTMLIDIITLSIGGFTISYFANFIDIKCAWRSMILAGISLGICGFTNSFLAVWMLARGGLPFEIAATVFSLMCVLGGIMLTTSYYGALSNEERFALIVLDKGQRYLLKNVNKEYTDKILIDVAQSQPENVNGYGSAESSKQPEEKK